MDNGKKQNQTIVLDLTPLTAYSALIVVINESWRKTEQVKPAEDSSQRDKEQRTTDNSSEQLSLGLPAKSGLWPLHSPNQQDSGQSRSEPQFPNCTILLKCPINCFVQPHGVIGRVRSDNTVSFHVRTFFWHQSEDILQSQWYSSVLPFQILGLTAGA